MRTPEQIADDLLRQVRPVLVQALREQQSAPNRKAPPWSEVALEDQQRKVRRLVRFLWQHNVAHLDRVGPAVWQEDPRRATDSAIRAVLCKANQFLASTGLAITREGELLRLE